MEQVKPRLLLVVPMLHQGGFERVCVRTARILRNDFEVTIAMFSDADIAYDINGLSVVNLDVPAQDGKLKKMVNVVKRTVRLRKLKKKLRPDLTYSFGPTANLINVLTPVRGQIWTGIRRIIIRRWICLFSRLCMRDCPERCWKHRLQGSRA